MLTFYVLRTSAVASSCHAVRTYALKEYDSCPSAKLNVRFGIESCVPGRYFNARLLASQQL
jgi:hypothetical protein